MLVIDELRAVGAGWRDKRAEAAYEASLKATKRASRTPACIVPSGSARPMKPGAFSWRSLRMRSKKADG
jgi:hypothetical protein